MPDFTIEWFQACGATTKTDKFFSARHGKDVEYQTVVSCDGTLDTCTCPGYNFHRHCKHIAELRQRLCCWDSRTSDVAQTPQQEMEAVCPKCGADTVQLKEAV